jgi:hypothetical protein
MGESVMVIFDKFRILFRMINFAIADNILMWKKDVWAKDLDSHWCCDGRECCCGGITIRQVWLEKHQPNASGDNNA